MSVDIFLSNRKASPNLLLEFRRHGNIYPKVQWKSKLANYPGERIMSIDNAIFR